MVCKSRLRMGKVPIRVLMIGAVLAVAMTALGPAPASGAACKRKTAGFYLLDRDEDATRRLALSLQSMPVSLTGALGDPERGRQLLANRQKGDCLSCHKLGVMAGAENQGSFGPPLDGVGSRLSKPQLRQAVVEPKAYFPDTIMPSYYKAERHGAPPILTAAEVEDLVAFLETLK